MSDVGEIPDPSDMPFDLWAGQVALLNNVDSLPHPSEEDWQDWAVALVAHPLFSYYNLPAPDYFENWQDWAAAAKLAYPGT
jgi:hypothetical protein